MPSNYDYYLLGRAASEEAHAPPLPRWRFNLLYNEFLRAIATVKNRALQSRVTQDTPNILRYTRLTALDELVSRGRKLYEQSTRASSASRPSGEGPQASGEEPPPSGPDPAGSGDREPRNPREPVLAGAGARPLPRGEGKEEEYTWRI